jgi:hypothetical protein
LLQIVAMELALMTWQRVEILTFAADKVSSLVVNQEMALGTKDIISWQRTCKVHFQPAVHFAAILIINC